MNPNYLRLTEGLELLTFFVFGPVLAIVIAYKSWRRNGIAPDSKRYGTRCAVFAVLFVLLFMLAKWLNADVRTHQYFLQLTCVLLSILWFGLAQGYFSPCWWTYGVGIEARLK